jgi:cAMP-dependent protein kinase regulator
MKRRERFEAFIKEIDLLQDLDPYERSKICDVVQSQTFKDGEYVIKQVSQILKHKGEMGDRFYMLEEGEAIATKGENGGNGEVVLEYKHGDYFGELALLKDEPRAANIIAKVFLAGLCLRET